MLKLTVIEAPENETPEGTSHIVGPAGATIGRTRDNTWTLTDEQSLLSRSHFKVEFSDGAYHLVDTSMNGSFLNDNSDPVGRGNRAPLAEGDTIRIGGYKIAVSLDAMEQKLPSIDSDPLPFMRSAKPDEPSLGDLPEIAADLPPLEDTGGGISLEPSPFDDIKPQALPDVFGGQDAHASDPLAGSGFPPPPSPQADFLSPPVNPEPEFLSPPVNPEAEFLSPPVNPEADFLAAPAEPESGFLSPPVNPEPDFGSADVAPPAPEESKSGSLGLQVPVASAPEAAPEIADNGSLIPDNWWEEEEENGAGKLAQEPEPEPEPAPMPAPPPPPPAASAAAPATPPSPSPSTAAPSSSPAVANDSDIEAQLRSALAGALGSHADGLPARDLLRAVEEMAAMLQASAPSLMQALSVRTRFKDQLRLDQTMVRARDNNPLKFCSSPEEALQHMLLNDHPGLLQGRLATEEAFRELAAHQTALVGALQPALKEAIAALSPQAVEAATEGEGVAAFALPKGKGKLWDSYRELYAKLCESDRGVLERRFMKSLAQHYERSLTALK